MEYNIKRQKIFTLVIFFWDLNLIKSFNIKHLHVYVKFVACVHGEAQIPVASCLTLTGHRQGTVLTGTSPLLDLAAGYTC